MIDGMSHLSSKLKCAHLLLSKDSKIYDLRIQNNIICLDRYVVKYKIPKMIQDYVIKQNFVSRNVSRKRYS